MPTQLAAYDFGQVMKFLKTVAIAKAMSQGAEQKWVPVKGVVFDIFYGFWKEKPGFYEVNVPRMKDISGAVLTEMERLAMNYLATVSRGPGEGQKYLAQMEKARSGYWDALYSQMQGANEANAEVMRQLGEFQHQLEVTIAVSAVVLAATGFYIIAGVGGTFVAVTPLGPMIVMGSTAAQAGTAGWLTAVGSTAYAVAHSEATAFRRIGATRVLDVGGEKICEAKAEGYETTIQEEDKVIERVNKKIDQLTQTAMNPSKSARVVNRVNKARNKLAGLKPGGMSPAELAAREQKVAALKPKAGFFGAGARYIPLVFATIELQESIDHLVETLDEGDE
jgi:hypothetical protein